MLRTLVVVVVVVVAYLDYCVYSFEIKLTDQELNTQSPIVIEDPLKSRINEKDNKIENIYYRTSLQSEIIIPLNGESFHHVHGEYGQPPEDETLDETDDPALQPWSILWYIGSFGGLIAFFLVVSCSEWCCRNRARRRSSRNSTCQTPTPSEAPPPAYDLFAPPSYESLCSNNGEKTEYQVYVVPVSAMEAIPEDSILQTNSYTVQNERSENTIPNNEVVLNVVRTAEQETQSERKREIATQT